MQETNREQVLKYRRSRKNKRMWRNFVRVMACIVVFCTTYALILPAITMEKEAYCGKEAHVHEASCYAGELSMICDTAQEPGTPLLHTHDALCYENEVLRCTLAELAGHVHTDSCYTTKTVPAHTHGEDCNGLVRGQLKCEIPEQAGHSHGAGCYVPGETLLCTEEVREGHAHGDSCFATERKLTCETAEGQGHSHSDACYVSATQLGCGKEETAGHSHNDGCYATEKKLTCETAADENHSHDDSCYTEEKKLTCEKSESAGHSHTDACYIQTQSLGCGLEEIPAHTHGEGCYTEIKTVKCEIPEDAGHTHSAACYEQVLNCAIPVSEGHAHSDACYEMVSAVVCGKEEREAETSETILSCTVPQYAPHTHSGDCYGEGGALTCGIIPAMVHQHTEECFQAAQNEENLLCEKEVHEHKLACFANPEADVETKADWDAMIAELKLTGNWREDVLTIAKSQLGYNESVKNYIVEEDGETMKGYTRYGAWYGVPYGDWCAMYVSFCLDYAGVEGMPQHCNCPAWINELEKLGLYHSESDYVPEPGDVIFFDWNADGSSDHVGLVTALDGDTVKTIEGNSGDTVGYHTYNLDHATIMGYGRLPDALTDTQRAAVDAVIAMIEEMPSADEIEAKVEAFELAEDYEGEEAWMTQVYQQVNDTYLAYIRLGENLQYYVTNRDKLLELEFIWSAMPLPDDGAEIAKTVNFSTSLLTSSNQFVLYVQGSDNKYYALDGNGNAVEIVIDPTSGAVKSTVSNPDVLYWTFTKNNNNYTIRNASTSKYIRLRDNNVIGNSENMTLTDSNDGSFTVRRNNNYLSYSNSAFGIGNSGSAAKLRMAQAPASVYIWFDGTCGGLESLEGAGDRRQKHVNGTALPDTWDGPSRYDYVLRGWYDIYNHKYYRAGDVAEFEEETVLYADWTAANYDIGRNNNHVVDTVTTNHFVTTRMFDYSAIFNMYSIGLNDASDFSNSSHTESWKEIQNNNKVGYQNQTTLGFVFRDWDDSNSARADLSYPNPRAQATDFHEIGSNADYPYGIVSGLYNQTRIDKLFSTANATDPESPDFVLGQAYLGTADHLLQYEDGYYFYNSQENAAAYHQSDNRFYVYDYLTRTTDAASGENDDPGRWSDFLPMNSPYIRDDYNTYQYGGTTNYQFNSKMISEDNNVDNNDGNGAGTNLWFGMQMDIKFYLPNDVGETFIENGQTVYGNKDIAGRDMVFEFSGDDDVWILIGDGIDANGDLKCYDADGNLTVAPKLLLDLGGIHRITSGTIDFSTGNIEMFSYKDDDNVPNNKWNTLMNTLESNLASVKQGNHYLRMYYLERGDSQSNLSIRFNISPRYQMTLQKEDAINRNKLDGAEFSVYTDQACTEPAELWHTKADYEAGKSPDNTFTISNGQGSIWGMAAGNVYYIKETKPPQLDANEDGENDYIIPKGLIKLTLKTDGETDYEVLEMVADAEGEEPTPGFSAYGFKVNPVTEEAFMVITNGTQVEDTTDITVAKQWVGGTERPDIKAYLTLDGQRIRETTLNEQNNWTYTWTDLPKYSDELDEEGKPIPLNYSVEEGLVPNYTGSVETVTSYEKVTTLLESKADLEDDKTYLLRNSSNNYLAVLNDGKSDTGFRWVNEATAKTDPMAQWMVTKNGNDVTLTNKSGYTLTYWSHSNFFAMNTPKNQDNQRQTLRYTKTADSGIRLYYDDSTDRYMSSNLNGDGKIERVDGQENQALILYPVTEVTTTEKVQVEGIMFQITNTYVEEQPKTSVTVKKNWTLGDGVTPADPSLYQNLMVSIRLKADGKDAGLPLRTLERADNWSYTFTDLPATKPDGTPIAYSVEEVWLFDGWTPTVKVTGNATDGYQVQITNHYTQKVQIPVEKKWSGVAENRQPESLQVYLYRVAGAGQTPEAMGYLTLSPENGWKGIFRVNAPMAGEQYYIYEPTETYYATYSSRTDTVMLNGKACSMGLVTFDEDNAPITVTVTNQEIVELPETGGYGEYLYMAVGLLLMLTSTAFLLYKHKKRRKIN